MTCNQLQLSYTKLAPEHNKVLY